MAAISSLTMPRVQLLAAVVLTACVLTASTAQADPPQERLSDYFGFLPLEIYKLDIGIANLALKDLDGDGASDVIVANNRRSRIDLLLSGKKPAVEAVARPSKPESNDLEYDRRMRLVSIAVNRQVHALAAGDLNGDGKADLAFYGSPAELQVLYNEGQGAFSLPKKIACGDALERPGAIAIGDFNQDGREDVVLLSEKELIFVYQTAAGGLSEPERVPHVASSPWIMKAIDLNGDKAKDLITIETEGDHAYHLRLATVEKRLGPEIRLAGEAPRAVTFGQIDGKGGDEILALDGRTSRARVMSLEEAARDETEKFGRLSFFALPAGGERGRSIAVGDLDGDGRADVLVTDPANAQVWSYTQTAKVGLSVGRSFPGLSGARTIRLAPRPGHKGDAVFVLSDTEKQIGVSMLTDNRLSFPTPLGIEGDPVAMDVGDLNNDRLADVVYIARIEPGKDRYALRWLTGKSNGEFEAGRFGSTSTFDLAGVSNAPTAMKLIDLNLDGRLDIVLFASYGPPIVLVSRADAAPRRLAALGPFSSATATGLVATELDGKAILLAQGAFARRIVLDAKDQWMVKDQYNAGRSGATLQAATALDVDGDGHKEVVAFDKPSKSIIVLERKDGVYRPAGRVPVGSINFDGFFTADFDGDHRDDLLIAGTDRFGVLHTGGTGPRLKLIAEFESKRSKARLGDLAAGDLNGDGLPDVVFSDIAEQSLEIATYTGEKTLMPALTFKIFEHKSYRNMAGLIEPREMVTGDVDNDHRDDLVLIIHDRVVIYRQDHGGTRAKPAATALQSPRP